MGFSIGGALKGAIGGFAGGGWAGAIGGALGGGFGESLSQSQDMSYYNYALNKDIMLWNMQNEYNLPKNQMQRYRDANLNPNLIYGQQNVADSVGRSSLSNQFDYLGQGSKLANDKMSRMAQYQGILSNQASIDEINARVQQIHNNIEIANKMLPYQQKALEMQIKNSEAGLTSPTALATILGKENAEKLAGSNSPLGSFVNNVNSALDWNKWKALGRKIKDEWNQPWN